MESTVLRLSWPEKVSNTGWSSANQHVIGVWAVELIAGILKAEHVEHAAITAIEWMTVGIDIPDAEGSLRPEELDAALAQVVRRYLPCPDVAVLRSQVKKRTELE
jgi:hypothetical protein